jgi:hypothetical protein
MSRVIRRVGGEAAMIEAESKRSPKIEPIKDAFIFEKPPELKKPSTNKQTNQPIPKIK